MENYNKEDKDNSSVKVAVRIRPMIQSETSKGSKNILQVFPAQQQLRIRDSEKGFTYNYVCDENVSQEHFYDMCIRDSIDNLFKGYNLTILAYGQTGSGKTYTMGTNYSEEDEVGIIPRAIRDIFHYVKDNFTYDFNITVSFMELYQETLYDLLSEKSREQAVLEIREDLRGILIPGLTEVSVFNACDTLKFLTKGSQGRATGSTNMNSQSSRSHAIFTVNISMQKKDNSNLNKTAKFHLVDLAGSERSKKTGATGVTFKEGININKGLLALGNVISALGDEKQQGFIGYRDSNLTRLLKDSLGGNSITLMIACVSPADYNLEETLSTLRYADRARKIKNKPVINQDPKAAEINRLNKLVQQLRLELVGQGGPIISQPELESLKKENGTLKTKNCQLTMQFSTTLNENTDLFERLMLMQTANERMTTKLKELKEEYNLTLGNLIVEDNLEGMVSHINNLNNIQTMLANIETERLKSEEEIRKHERSENNKSGSTNTNVTTESELSERQECHMKQQIALNHQLQEVTKSLAMKEHLAQQMVENNLYMVDYNAIQQNEEKVTSLQREKEELLQQLKQAQVQGGANKLSEHRRKRVQELEKQIQDLHKKINEQSRMIKLKEKDEQKIKQLNSEIQQMKFMKVKLIKNMKGESEQFRMWKLQRERELLKLKDQDRKRLNQIVKMESMHSRQQNVLKRKVEEAVAINKRLKDALALRKNVQDQKNSGKIERLGPWIQQELEIFVSTVDAEASLAILLEDRALLAGQLDSLKAQTDQDRNLDDLKQIEEEIELRSSQIQDLQQKILDSNQENKLKTRWENVQSMAEAKYCLNVLFDLTADIARKDVTNAVKIAELQNAQLEITEKLNEQQNSNEFMVANHAIEMATLQKDCEDKVSVLLRQLRGIPMEGVELEQQKLCEIQQLHIQKLEDERELIESESREAIKKLQVENDDLKMRLEEIKSALQVQQAPPSTPENIRTAVFNKRHRKVNSTLSIYTAEHADTEGLSDDTEADPDWRKTPLAKMLQKLKASSIIPERATSKRNSDGSCTCKGNCSKRTCSCKKFNKPCSSLCKCSKIICLNQNTDEENETEVDHKDLPTEEEEEDVIEGSSKKARTLVDETNVGIQSKTRRVKRGNIFPSNY